MFFARCLSCLLHNVSKFMLTYVLWLMCTSLKMFVQNAIGKSGLGTASNDIIWHCSTNGLSAMVVIISSWCYMWTVVLIWL